MRNADRKPVNMRKSMGWTVSRDNVIIRADMRLKCQVQTWCFDRCLSPVRKVSGTMDFAEMCVTGLEQELCTQNFFFHSLSWWSIISYNTINFVLELMIIFKHIRKKLFIFALHSSSYIKMIVWNRVLKTSIFHISLYFINLKNGRKNFVHRVPVQTL